MHYLVCEKYLIIFVPITILTTEDKKQKRRESKEMIQSSTGSVVGWSLDRSSQLNTVFHHELKDPLVQVVSCFSSMGLPSFARCKVLFRTVTQREPGLDITGLARAAVAGDERALDLFSSW